MTTAKKAPARKKPGTTAAVAAAAAGVTESQTPAPAGVLDLDNAVRPPRADGTPWPELFRFSFAGQTWTLVDPGECSWQDLQLGLRGPATFFRIAVQADDVDKARLISTPMPGWKFSLIMHNYWRHYGFDPESVGLPQLQ